MESFEVNNCTLMNSSLSGDVVSGVNHSCYADTVYYGNFAVINTSITARIVSGLMYLRTHEPAGQADAEATIENCYVEIDVDSADKIAGAVYMLHSKSSLQQCLFAMTLKADIDSSCQVALVLYGSGEFQRSIEDAYLRVNNAGNISITVAPNTLTFDRVVIEMNGIDPNIRFHCIVRRRRSARTEDDAY